ncbi:metallophosphoesterase [Paenibacillus cymbidii]|uniref:metallophosphoesterase n=1 Tax=Paenibacillus cymbidii TaxID=1639034 RepID=UPI00107FE448|nr:metallophosphoesterase [Paenibacillus cymbidii]
MVLIVLVVVLLCIFLLAMQTLWVKRSVHRLRTESEPAFTVVQLSDLHGRIRFLNGSLSGMVNRINPDYVVITGDLTSRKHQFDRVLNEIRNINCSSIYFVPGNYEREGRAGISKKRYTEEEYQTMMRRLQKQNVVVLSNSSSTIAGNPGKCLLYGFDNSIYGNERLTVAKEEIESYEYCILLAHSPDIVRYIREKELPYDLLLVGHTHGGQIRLFNRTIGAYKNCHVGLKKMDHRKHFYINRGLGTVRLPFRLACPPEIAVFHFGAERPSRSRR